MKMIRYDHIVQLTFFPRLFPVNCFLVEEQDDLTLVDAALPFSAKAIVQAAERIGKPIRRIVLTHAHDDHVGALDRLKQMLPEAEVAISARDARLLAGDVTLDPGEPPTPIRGGVPKAVRTRPDRLLADGERIGSLRAVAAPGHTPGLLAFLDERSGALLAGDAFQTRGGIAVSGQRKVLFPFPAWATWHAETALASARRLQELRPSLLAVGHGMPLQRPAAAIDRAIREAEAALERRSGR